MEWAGKEGGADQAGKLGRLHAHCRLRCRHAATHWLRQIGTIKGALPTMCRDVFADILTKCNIVTTPVSGHLHALFI